MKAKTAETWITPALFVATLLISPMVLAAQEAREDVLQPKVIVEVDGLACPFCAYGLEQRIQEIRSVQQSIINIEAGTVELTPNEGKHIDIDEVKAAVKAGGFTARGEVGVALAGQLIDWNGVPALSINSTNRAGKNVTTIYVLKENRQLKRLKASAKSSGQEVFITGQASEAPPLGHPDRHPYIVDIKTFQVL